MSRAARASVAVALTGIAVVLLLLALDVLRVESSLRESDLAFRERPVQASLWRAEQTLPFGAARRLLGVGDDITFRRGVRLFRNTHGNLYQALDPELDPLRGRAQIALTRVAVSDPDVSRRSMAENLLGVVAFANAIRDQATRETFLVNSTAAFQSAIKHDPGNDDAKHNLELALVWLQAVDFDQSTSSGGQQRGAFGGAAGGGNPGSGY